MTKRVVGYSKHYSGYGHQAGAETTLHATMRVLSVAGWECTVLLGKVHPGVTDFTLDGVRVIAPQDARQSKRLPFEVFPGASLLITQLSAAGRGGIVAKQLGIPSLHMIHNDHLHNEKTALKYTDLCIYNTDVIKDQWSLPGMVLHPVIFPQDRRVESKNTFDCTLINLSTGDDHNYNKGYATFYELARRMPNRKFLAVKGAYGIQHVEELPNITFLEHQKDMSWVYQNSSVLLLPSQYESYGRVIVEAAEYGVPTVATEGLPGVVEALGGSGIYCPFGDYGSWERAVNHVLDNLSTYSSMARSRFESNLSRQNEEIEDFLTLCDILHEDGLSVARDYLSIPEKG